MKRTPTCSPCDLIQEHISHDPWRVLVACMLMNMTVGLTMRPYMWKLFDRWPNANQLAIADESELRELIRPLGFYNRRTKHLIAMSKAYSAGAWNTPLDLPGCGKYAYDSWRIFCTNEDVSIDDVTDKELRRYLHWKSTGEYISQDRRI